MEQNATGKTTVEDDHKRLTPLGQHGESQLWWAERRTANGAVDEENAHYFLQLRGSYRERGQAYGYLMAEQILATAVDMKAFFQPPAEWPKIAETRVLPNLPAKYREEVEGLLDGIIERRGDLGSMTRGDIVLQVLSICAPGSDYIPLLAGDGSPGHSTANAVFGSHTRDSRAAGDVVTVGSPGFPGVSRAVVENRVLVNYRSSSSEENSYAVIAFAGSLGLYSVGMNAEGITLSGTAAAAGVDREPLGPEPGWLPLALMARQILATRVEEDWRETVAGLIGQSQPAILVLLSGGARDGNPPFGLAYESTTNLVPGYPQSVERFPGWDVLGEGDCNLDWRGDYALLEGEIYRRGDGVLFDLDGREVASLTASEVDGDGDPTTGSITRGGVAGTWHRRPRGHIHGLGIITVDREGQSGCYVLDDGETWGRWQRTAAAEATYSDATGKAIGVTSLEEMGGIGVKGHFERDGARRVFYAWKRYWDAEYLDLNNIQWLPQVQRFIPKELHDAGGYMGGDNRYNCITSQVAGRTDVDAETFIDLLRQGLGVEVGPPVPEGEEPPNPGGLYEPLPADGPLGGWSAGLAATSARHREMLVQFGHVYTDGYAPALNVRREPARSLSHPDTREQPPSGIRAHLQRSKGGVKMQRYMRRKPWNTVLAIAVATLVSSVWAEEATRTTVLLEAEQFCLNPYVEIRPLEGASAGKAIDVNREGGAASYEKNRPSRTLRMERPGHYTAWVRYYKRSTAFGGVGILVEDEAGDQVAFHRLHFSLDLMGSRPYEAPDAPYLTGQGFVWERFPVTFERPMEVTITLGPSPRTGGEWDEPTVDCFVLTDDEALDPRGVDIAALGDLTTAGQGPAAEASQQDATAHPDRPDGFVPGTPYTPHVSFFSGAASADERFELALVNNWATFMDYARLVGLGFTHDHAAGFALEAGNPYGVLTNAPVECLAGMEEDQMPDPPTGRMIFYSKPPYTEADQDPAWDRYVSDQLSLNYGPARQGAERIIRREMQPYLERADAFVNRWRVSVEEGGWLDYSAYAQKAFREWLASRHSTIGRLNAIWGTAYDEFDEIEAPRSPAEDMAGWLEFREFSGQVYCDRVAATVATVRGADPRKRPPFFQNSNLDLLSPYFMSFRPMDYDYLLNVALDDVDTFMWDGYSADDYVGCDIDCIAGLSGHRKKLGIAEWGVHTNDPRIAARSFWGTISKGLKLMTCFQLQDPLFDASYPKWSLLNPDFTPKAKLGAFADAAHEIHRLEPLLMEAQIAYPVKPVAMYYSRIDLSLAKPRASQWGGGHDSHQRVYEVLRSAGYSVTWITPSQIRAGRLDEVGALVMVDCQHVPADAAQVLAAWVESGGVVIGDRFPGARDEYGRTQDILAPVFGVRKMVEEGGAAGTRGRVAEQESSQGYGPETGLAFEPEQIEQTIVEMYQQWDCRHPVAQRIGNFMLSGYGYEKVENVAGETIAMSYYTYPGLVLNEYGRGVALYFAAMMGTLYDGAATRYEWDTAHSGTGYQRVLSAFLEYAGVQPTARVLIEPSRVRSLVRVETPLVTPDGNILVGLTSYNAGPLQPFDLEVALPPQAREFGAVYAAIGGSRGLEKLAFEVEDGKLRVRMPGFDTHATIVAVRSFAPLVSLQIEGLMRGEAHLAEAHPDEEFTIETTVHNSSDEPLPPGEVRLYLSRGWFHRTGTIAMEAIPPWQSQSATFQVKTSPVGGDLRLRPLVVKYEAGSSRSTPATEVVWWSRPAGRADTEWR